MRRFSYLVLLILSLYFFMSPFIIKTAETLSGRAAGEFIGLIGAISAWYGMRTGKRGAAIGVMITGILAVLWGLIGGRIFDLGGMAHNVFIGLILLVFALWSYRLTPKDAFEVDVGGQTKQISSLSIEHGRLLAMSEEGGVEKQFSMDAESLWVALSSLDYESAKRLINFIRKGKDRANKRKS